MSGTYKFGDKAEGIRILQQALADNGFNPGVVDSVFGPATLNAINDARAAYKLEGINRVDAELLERLGITKPKPPKKPNFLETLSVIKDLYDLWKGKPMNSTWLTSFVGTTAFKYLVAMLATYIASKLGLDKGSIEGILTQLIGVAMGVWGAWEASRSKIVMNGEKVSVSDLSTAEKKVVADIVEAKK